MAKLKSFEQFVAEMDRTEEIEQDVVDATAPSNEEAEEVEEAGETGTPAEELEDETEDVTEPIVDADGEEVDGEVEDVEKDLELDGEGDAEGEEITEEVEAEVSEEEAEEEAEEVNAEESNPTVVEMLKEVYEMVKNEAKVWEEDAHDEHTVESYMKENAALVAALSANTLKEMKEEYSIEAYEAACNEMIEAYTKKVNEMKEADSVSDAEDAAE